MRGRDDEYDLDDREYPDEPDESEDEAAYLPCPHCFGTIHDESERCPHCGLYLSEEDISRRPPWWVILGVILGLIVVIYWIFRP